MTPGRYGRLGNHTLPVFPTNVNIIIPSSCEYVPLPSKRDFAGMIMNLEIVGVGGDLKYLRGPNSHRVCKEGGRGGESAVGDVTAEARSCGFREGGK